MPTRAQLDTYSHWRGRLVELPGHDLLYVKNAKAATSATVVWLTRHHIGNPDWAPTGSIHRDTTLRGGRRTPWPRIRRLLNNPDVVRFTFVRHPLARVESAYLDKIANPAKRVPGSPAAAMLHQLQQALGQTEDLDADLTPDQFLDAIVNTPPMDLDPHWRPQHLNVLHPLVDYTVTGRLETYAADLARVAEHAGLPPLPAVTRNASTGAHGLFHQPALRRRIETIYARDYELYGYETG